jgi:hypothetical protein
MTDSTSAVVHLRAPKCHGQSLIVPSYPELLAHLNVIRQTSRWPMFVCGGLESHELCKQGRAELLQAAIRYTRSYRDVQVPETREVFVLTGHQPELFHPGVWFKNILADALARHTAGVAVHVVIDNDLPGSLAIKCPTTNEGRVRQVRCLLDLSSPRIPYEERAVRDWQLFASFGNRAAAYVQPLVSEPLVETFWPLVLEAARRTGRLGVAIAQARHQWEARWGMQTLEIPLSEVCRLDAVRWFLSQMIYEGALLHEHYNRALTAFRQRYGIRRSSHPVAELARQEDWYELPFWIWTRSQPQRRGLWCRVHPRCLEIGDRRGLRLCWPGSGAGLAAAVEAWQEAEYRGVCIRPRALITTMTLRMLLSDLFIHGIGGAHYDGLTDDIARLFWGQPPPPFATATATVHLPVPHEAVSDEDLTRLQVLLRELTYHPERFLADTTDETVRHLIEEKQRWKGTVIPPLRRRQYEVITRINQQLQPYVQPIREAVQQQLADLQDKWTITRILTSREYAFCLFPDTFLQNLWPQLCPATTVGSGTAPGNESHFTGLTGCHC